MLKGKRVCYSISAKVTKGLLILRYNILCPSKYLLRRNNEILLEPYNGKTKKTLGDRAFAVAAPRLFNSLPREIRQETCFNTFKTRVKNFFVSHGFC